MKSEKILSAIDAGTESILMHYGVKAQVIKTCEELCELTVQLCKHLNDPSLDNIQNIVDEIADVSIMVEQMRKVFGADKVDERILFKLEKSVDKIHANLSIFKNEHKEVPNA